MLSTSKEIKANVYSFPWNKMFKAAMVLQHTDTDLTVV